MEGPGRPGHFEGVVTVVTKLFNATMPDVAIFGEKDYQQLAIVRRLVRDLDLGVEVIGHHIVRDPDGLAMSSRNLRLTPAQRAAAVCVPRSLDAAVAAAADGESPRRIVAAAERTIAAEPLARHEYTTVVDASSLQELREIGPTDRRPGRVRVATAVWFGDVRLIDNRDVFPGRPGRAVRGTGVARHAGEHDHQDHSVEQRVGDDGRPDPAEEVGGPAEHDADPGEHEDQPDVAGPTHRIDVGDPEQQALQQDRRRPGDDAAEAP
jgi:hypothetical protein